MNFNKIILFVSILFALTFVACSDVDTSGGSTEETDVYAYARLAGHIMLVSYEQSTDSVLISSTLWKGFMVRMTELDPVTLDTTENVYYSSLTDSSGMFSFDSVTLKSPYVMLELSPLGDVNWWTQGEEWDWFYRYQSKPVPYRAIVDLREVKDVSINVMSSLEAYRLLYLVRQGMNFDAAKRQADRDVMDAFGFYDAPFYYGGPVNFLNDDDIDAVYFVSIFTSIFTASSDKCINLQAVDVFAVKGSFVDISDSAKQACKEVMGPALWYGRNGTLDEESKMYGNFLSSLYGLGKCTDEKEGDSLEIEFLGPELTLKVKCESGDWKPSAFRTVQEEIERSEGTMTDERDGKTYKTVTYTFNGITQTWMAENLTYSNETITPVLDSAAIEFLKSRLEFMATHDLTCNIDDGWLCTLDSTYWNSYVEYKWFEAMGLDSSSVSMDSGMVDLDMIVIMVDSVEKTKGYYQGLCPDGWRLPKVDDWQQLFKQAYRSQGGLVEGKRGNWVTGSYYLPSIGFGPMTTEDFVIRLENSDGDPDFGTQLYGCLFSYNLKYVWDKTTMLDMNTRMSVRCIKN